MKQEDKMANFLKENRFDEKSEVNLEFEKYIEEQKRKLRSLIRF